MADQEKTKGRQTVIFIISAIVGLVVFSVWYWAVGCNWRRELEALFSGLAFVGIICTVLLQSEELKLQRKELEDTRVVLDRAAKAQEKSEEALSNQIKAMNRQALIDAYSAVVEYYDNVERKSNHRANEKRDHALANLKQLIDELDAVQGRSQQRPFGWMEA